jgi:hypothetical protein
MTWKECGRKLARSNLRKYPTTFAWKHCGIPRRTIVRICRCPGRDSNRARSEHNAVMLPVLLTCVVHPRFLIYVDMEQGHTTAWGAGERSPTEYIMYYPYMFFYT